MNTTHKNGLEYAQKLDQQDPLREYRVLFHIPRQNGRDQIYFCGNSLGLQPKKVREYIEDELKAWAELGVEGHFHSKRPWFSYHHFLQEPMARLVGAKPLEVVAMNTLSVNLNLLMVSFYRPLPERYKIIMEAHAFPSDQYAVENQVRFHGYDPEDAIIEVTPRKGEHNLRTEDILSVIKEHGASTALVLFGGVQYYSGQFFNIKTITEAAHQQGATAGFDLAHAAGNVILKLHDWQVDFATWCSYKYLNSGPGGVSGVFVHEKHGNDESLPRFAGWWGNDEKSRFLMEKGFHPQSGAAGWQMSNAQILPMAAHLASLEIFDRAGMSALREKSLAMTSYLGFLLAHEALQGLKLITPREIEQRGCQFSLLTGPNGKAIFDMLTSKGVVVDWREPNVIRLAPVPLYNTFEDIFRFVEILKEASSAN